MAVYTGLVWRLTAGQTRYAIPAYYRDEAAQALGHEPVLVDWEYAIEAEDPHAVRDNGFVRGRSTADSRRPDTWKDVHRAGLFDLSTPRGLVPLLHATLLDASSEITVFAVAPGSDRLKDLVARVLVNKTQAAQLLVSVSYVGTWDRKKGRRLVGFYAVMYFAGLRPSEAVGLSKADCFLPEKG
ncbi:hypothetical protein [Streptomyces phaeochromogenes]|uniref:hypothetical protein n=1 Tax=Streptomyces phaeochromogenes TaxID=1923 RepID=UPI00398D35D5